MNQIQLITNAKAIPKLFDCTELLLKMFIGFEFHLFYNIDIIIVVFVGKKY